jgi:hypothetical protein
MEKPTETLGRILDGLVPEVAESFYRPLAGFQDPFGDARKLIERGGLDECAHQLEITHAGINIVELVCEILNNVPLLPPPINTDYRPFRHAHPFPPHLVCYALAYIKERPQPSFIEPFVKLVVRTGWWAGDENCIDDLLRALSDEAEVCRIAAGTIPLGLSHGAVFAAGQLLYHLRYGDAWGLRDYIREQYERALLTLKDPDDLREVKRRLASGFKPWTTLRP